MSVVVETILKHAIQEGLGLPQDPIQNDILQAAVAKYNQCGKTLFDLYPWKNSKIAQFEVSPTDGILTLPLTVDITRAVMAVDTNSTDDEDTFIWVQDDIDAAIRGEQVSSSRFQTMADDTTTGARRLLVNADDNVSTYKVLGLKRFVKATIEPTYSAGDPSATPTDYRVITWPIDQIDQVIENYLSDELRGWDGQSRQNVWRDQLEVELSRINKLEARQAVAVPSDPAWSNLGIANGNYYGGRCG